MDISFRYTLAAHGGFEPESQSKTRVGIIDQVNSLFLVWCPEGRTLVMGSYMFGVLFKDSDIDIICVAPPSTTRESFNSEFYQILKNTPNIAFCSGVFRARVPIIKLLIEDISVDLLFANDAAPSDIVSQLSMNGYENNTFIMQVLPNLDSFRDLLRTVKLWSKKRSLYSNKLGYLGGFSWTMLVTKVCMMYPEDRGEDLLNKFFKFYQTWDWTNPISLHGDCISDGHCMCVYTPTQPETNSAYTLTYSGFKAIKQEIELAYKISCNDNHKLLFEELDFFQDFKLFLRIDLYSKQQNKLRKWAGMIQSKFKWLVKALETDFSKAVFRPYTKCFDLRTQEYDFGLGFFIGLNFGGHYTHMNLQGIVLSFCSMISEIQKDSCHYYIKLQHRDEIEDEIRHQLRNDLV